MQSRITFDTQLKIALIQEAKAALPDDSDGTELVPSQSDMDHQLS